MTRLDKIFDKINRRSSDVSTESPSVLLNSFDGHRILRNRAKSMSLMSNTSSNSTLSLPPNEAKRNRSKSVGKKHTKDLIIQETKQVVQKKLSTLLQELSLQEPLLAKMNNSNNSSISKHISVYVANSNNCIYLAPASSASFTYEDVENGGVPHVNQDVESDSENSTESPATPEDEINEDTLLPHLNNKIKTVRSPNYLCTKIDSEIPIPHTFGVIIELHKDTPLNLVKFEFASTTNILWPSGDPYNKSHTRDKFKIGKLDWIKSLANADYYINSLNSSDFKAKKIDTEELAKRTRYYRLKRQRVGRKGAYDSTLDLLEEEEDLSEFYDQRLDNQPIYKAGIYVFVLPILIPEHIPQTITSISGSLNHVLSVSLQRSSEKLNRKLTMTASYNLPMVRTPPSSVNSFVDKPIYVNRVWNNSLHYIITFPMKYVALGSEHTINVKVVPLVKDVIIKRIKFNVLERITYVSEDLSKEFDYDGDDPFFLKPSLSDNKTRERIISVCELKTKNKPSNGVNEPYKEEVIKCPDNNLLYSCYEAQNDTESSHFDDIENFKVEDPLLKDRDHRHHLHLPTEFVKPSKKKSLSNLPAQSKPKEFMVASPLDINIALPFLTTRNDKLIQTYNDEEKLKNLSGSAPNSRKASIMSTDSVHSGSYIPSSPIIGALETNLTHIHNELLASNNDDDTDFLTPDSSAFMHQFSHNNMKENIQHGYTTVGRALYPDSNFRHIQISHRLQVCFRISKPDPNDNNRMHHYEVVVDTPLILLSSKCNDESIQLPRYDEVEYSTDSIPQDTLLPETSNTSSAISFRTPNYDKSHVGYYQTNENGEVHGKGFTIKPWNRDQTAESLPSFKEAMSSLPSPATRTVSISEDPLSRVPSISIDSPEFQESGDPPAYDSYDNQYSGPLNIDAMVNFVPSDSPSNAGSSRLRSSLVNSFAPAGLSSAMNSSISDGLSVSPTNTASIPMLNIHDGLNNSSTSTSGSVSKVDDGSILSLDSPPNAEDSGSVLSLQYSDNITNIPNTESSSCVLTSDSSNLISNTKSSTNDVSSSSASNSKAESSVEIPIESNIARYEGEDEQESNDVEEGKTRGQEPRDMEGTVSTDMENTTSNVLDINEDNHIEGYQVKNIEGGSEAIETDDDVVPDLEPVSAFNRDLQDLNEKEKKIFSVPNDSESNLSIITHGSVYDQRIPLLRNMSSESSILLAKHNTTASQNKISTDNLSIITESNKGHEIYHAY